MTFLAFY